MGVAGGDAKLGGARGDARRRGRTVFYKRLEL